MARSAALGISHWRKSGILAARADERPVSEQCSVVTSGHQGRSDRSSDSLTPLAVPAASRINPPAACDNALPAFIAASPLAPGAPPQRFTAARGRDFGIQRRMDRIGV